MTGNHGIEASSVSTGQRENPQCRICGREGGTVERSTGHWFAASALLIALAGCVHQTDKVAPTEQPLPSEFPGVVRLLLPEAIYAAPGVEMNVYFDNVVAVPRPGNYIFDVTCPKGTQQSERWTYTPEPGDVGRYPFALDVLDSANSVVARGRRPRGRKRLHRARSSQSGLCSQLPRPYSGAERQDNRGRHPTVRWRASGSLRLQTDRGHHLLLAQGAVGGTGAVTQAGVPPSRTASPVRESPFTGGSAKVRLAATAGGALRIPAGTPFQCASGWNEPYSELRSTCSL